ncbi:hypothetical protein [Zwartia sp.]|uniref:hypothetical protein n=1 Tax=Zwartia sp. TaxID=2978004 RepID=UPI003BB01B4F
MSKSVVIDRSLNAMGELLIWTDIAPEKEEDFNQWYDTEHMQERASIPGFQWSRRYHSETAPRPYLALYRTDTLHIFTSAPYRKAFENQTEWSVRNFSAMHNTNRRVNAVTEVMGAGTGAVVSLICLGSDENAQAALALTDALCREVSGVIALRVLTPDSTLSTPLPSEDASKRVLEPYMVIDTTTLASAEAAGAWMVARLKLTSNAQHTFRLLWDLRASDLK